MKVLTQESSIQSWNLIGPAVVSASKSGAILPRRREGIVVTDNGVALIEPLYRTRTT
jgi:hypothetical protein